MAMILIGHKVVKRVNKRIIHKRIFFFWLILDNIEEHRLRLTHSSGRRRKHLQASALLFFFLSLSECRCQDIHDLFASNYASNMYIQKCLKIRRLNPINAVITLAFIILFWYTLQWYFPPPITFWLATPVNKTIPLNQALTLDAKRAFLKNDSLIIAVCIRDAERHLSIFRENIDNITSLFGDYHIFVGESDSSDETSIFLRQWSENTTQVTIKTYGNLSASIPRRSERIAYCRNNLLDEARHHPLSQRSNHTFYMVVDVDRNTRLDQRNFLSNFDYAIPEWGAMTASQRGIYYDIWALRNDVVNYDCWRMAYNIFVILVTRNRAIQRYVLVHQEPIPSNHSLIPVDSAFCGAAIYQMKYIHQCRYSGYDSGEICEHVPFNRCVTRNGGQIFINPQFQID